MMNSGSQTDAVVMVWKSVFSIMHTSIPENSLSELLDWAALHGISMDRDAALDFGLWQELGCAIRHKLSFGDLAVLELFQTWCSMFILLTDLNCGSRAGLPVLVASEGEISKVDPTDWAPGARGGGSEKTPPGPRAEPSPEPAPGHPAQSQGSALPKDPAPTDELVGVSGKQEGVQPALPFGSAASTAYSGLRVSGLASWTPMAASSPSAQAAAALRMPGCTFLPGIAPGNVAHASAALRMPGCGP